MSHIERCQHALVRYCSPSHKITALGTSETARLVSPELTFDDTESPFVVNCTAILFYTHHRGILEREPRQRERSAHGHMKQDTSTSGIQRRAAARHGHDAAFADRNG